MRIKKSELSDEERKQKLVENRKKWNKKYNSKPENKERVADYQKEYRKKPEVIAKRLEKERRPEAVEKRNAYYADVEIKRNMDVKIECFTHYSKEISKSDVPICACCGISDIRFLTLDHIDGRKNLPEKEKRLNTVALWKFLLEKHLPSGYQILCFNCNMGKGPRKYCPHQLDRMEN